MGERDDGSDISARLMAERLAEAEERACHAQPKWEPSSLMARLEAAEAENARLLSSLHEERRQREEIIGALDLSPGAPLDAILRRIESLTEAEQGEPDGEPLDLVALPRPEDLPTWYAFEVAEYVSDLAERLMGQKP